MSERPRRKPPDENERRPRDPRYSQSLQRGLAILRCFTPKRPVLGIADIADDLGMSRSTTHRYVITLVALGYLEQGASRKYRLGLRVTDLGMSALNSTGLREHAHPYLEELRQRTSYTTSLGVLDGVDLVPHSSTFTTKDFVALGDLLSTAGCISARLGYGHDDDRSGGG
jgi:AraC-like DNA-binding protein